MAGITRLAPSMSAPDRKQACLGQARACREKAETDPANRDYWIDEAIKWLERAVAPVGHIVITLEETVKLTPSDRTAEG